MRLIIAVFALFISSGIFSQVPQPRCFDYDNGGNRKERALCDIPVKPNEADDLFVPDRIAQEVDPGTFTDYEDLSGLIVYPNPTSGFLRIEAGYGAGALLYLFDMSGNVIRSYGHVPATVDLSEFPAGMYVLVVQEGDRTGIVKIIKNK